MVVPLTVKTACAYVREHHRHHRAPQGGMWALGCEHDGKLVGVAIVGRPVARRLSDGKTCEVTRLATDGTRNACSFLYGAVRRVAQQMGYRKVITYTLANESGASLRAAGFELAAKTRGGSWSRPSRVRADAHPLQMKFRWEAA